MFHVQNNGGNPEAPFHFPALCAAQLTDNYAVVPIIADLYILLHPGGVVPRPSPDVDVSGSPSASTVEYTGSDGESDTELPRGL